MPNFYLYHPGQQKELVSTKGLNKMRKRATKINDNLISFRRRSHYSDSLNGCSIDIPGLRTIVDPSVSFSRKLFWTLLILIFSVVCVIQLANRVVNYMEMPVSVAVSMEYANEVEFPVLVLCPAQQPISPYDPPSSLIQKAGERWCSKNKALCLEGNIFDTIQHIPFTQLAITLPDLWTEFNISDDDLSFPDIYCVIAECNLKFLKKFPVKTVMGNCLGISYEKPLTYLGGTTYIPVSFENGNYEYTVNGQTYAAWYYFYKRNIPPIYDIYMKTETLAKDRVTTHRLFTKKFVYLNRTTQSCWDEERTSNCRNSCMKRELEKVLPCRLPFISFESLKFCDTWNQSAEAVRAALSLYTRPFNALSCPCVRPCNETMYTSITTVDTKSIGNVTQLQLRFGNNIINTVAETPAYEFSSLVSDVGGILGFYFGISILTVVKWVDEFLHTRKCLLSQIKNRKKVRCCHSS